MPPAQRQDMSCFAHVCPLTSGSLQGDLSGLFSHKSTRVFPFLLSLPNITEAAPCVEILTSEKDPPNHQSERCHRPAGSWEAGGGRGPVLMSGFRFVT